VSLNVAVILVGLLLAFVGALVASRGRKAPQEPVCGACRYPVRGLPGWVCPECGGDFREVGIATPALFRSGRRRIRIVFMLALFVPLVLGTYAMHASAQAARARAAAAAAAARMSAARAQAIQPFLTAIAADADPTTRPAPAIPDVPERRLAAPITATRPASARDERP